MKTLEVNQTKESPYVYFNPQEGVFKLEGRSTIQDDNFFFEFYIPIINFLEEYKQVALAKSVFYFKIDYLDERSSNFYFDIFGKLDELQAFTEVSVLWYFGDEEQAEFGEEFSDHFELPFTFIEEKNF